MYKTILIPVENRETDQTILRHIRPLARLTNAKLMLVHVADGWVARNYEGLKLRESEEMKEDRDYLLSLEQELRAEGFEVNSVLAMGEPSTEIIKLARKEPVDLIAMSTHGHRLISDLLYGSTADKVRHNVDIPVLLLKVKN
jgi:nucleotide-binding universal stress UspA family protein